MPPGIPLRSADSLGPTALVLIGALIAAPRFGLISLGIQFAGDSHTFALVAENILEHFCVSMSDPADGDCAPHWGGNQLPGYPTFVALVWWVAGKSLAAPLFAQTLITSTAGVYLVRSIVKAGYGRRAAWLVTAVIALSPSLVGWSRTFLTESLAIAVSLWVFAELLRSISDSRLRVWPLGIALAVGLFVRYDLLIQAIPIVVVAFAIHRPRIAVSYLAAVAVMTLLPYGAWTARSVVAGLPAIPPFGITPDGHVVAPGVLSWVGTWLDDQSLLPQTVWALVNRDYQSFSPPPPAFDEHIGGARAREAVARLRLLQGHDVGADLDAEFAAIARAATAADPLGQWVVLPAKRAASLWGSPLPGLGWPSYLSETDRQNILQALSPPSVGGALSVLVRHPQVVFVKALVTGYRYAALLLVAALLVFSFRQEGRSFRVVVWLSVFYALSRTALFSQTILIETRYLVEAMAWLDVALAIGLAHLWSARADRRRDRLALPSVT